MRRTGADSHLAIRRIIFGGFVLIAMLAVIFPQWLTWFAQLIGVGRGTDLLLYMLCMIFLVFVYTQFRRNAEMQQKVTQLARTIALMEAQQRQSRVPDDNAQGQSKE